MYQVRLTVDGQTTSQSFEVKGDPQLSTSAADYAKQLELGLKIRDKVTETHNAIIQIRDVRKQVDDLLKRVAGQPGFKVINDAATPLKKNLTAVEESLYQTKNRSSQDPLNFPIRLNNKLAALPESCRAQMPRRPISRMRSTMNWSYRSMRSWPSWLRS